MYKILYVVNEELAGKEKETFLTLLNNYSKDKCVIKVAVPFKSKIIPYLQKAGAEYTEYSQKDIKAFKELLKVEQPDVVHTSFYKPVLSAAKKLHIPSVCTELNFDTEIHKGVSHFMDKWYKFRTVSRLIVTGMGTPDIADIPKSRVSYIKPGVTRIEKVDEDMLVKMRAFYGLKENDIVFSTFADIDNSGGHECLLSAAERIIERGVDFKLFICGKGDGSNKVKEYIRTKGLSDNVLFLGDVRDTASVLNVSDVLVDASTVEKNYDLKVLMALSIGVPCILSDSYKNKLDAGENYFATDDEIMLTEYMLALLNNREHYASCSEKALTGFKNVYDGRIFAENTEDVYLSLIKNISVDK